MKRPQIFRKHKTVMEQKGGDAIPLTPEEFLVPMNYEISPEFMAQELKNAKFMALFSEGELDAGNEDVRDNSVEAFKKKALLDLEQQRVHHHLTIENLALENESHRIQFEQHSQEVEQLVEEQKKVVARLKEKMNPSKEKSDHGQK